MPDTRTAPATRPAAERRALRLTPERLEVRTTDDGSIEISGYAAVFDTPSDGLPFVEVIQRGAFTRSLANSPDVRLLYNHDPDSVMARTTAGNLTVTEDDRGLRFVATVAGDDPDALRVAAKMRAGNVDQCSFAFWVFEGGAAWRTTPDGGRERVLTELDIDGGDVSVVTYAAYGATSAEIRTSLPGDPADVSAGNPGEPVDEVSDEDRSRKRARTPDCSPDGSIPAQRSLNGWTFDDAWPLLDAAIGEATGLSYWAYYITAWTDTWVVYVDDSRRPWSLWQVDYDVAADGTVTLGTPIEVVARTEYLAVTADGALEDRSGDTSDTITPMHARLWLDASRLVAATSNQE